MGKFWWQKDEQTSSGQQTAAKQTDNQQSAFWWQKDKKQVSDSGFWWQEDNYSATVGNNITNRVNNWLKNHDNYVKNYQTRYGSRKFNYEDAYVKDSGSWLDTVSKQKRSFDEEADSILEYMDKNQRYLDKGWMKSVKDTLTSARGAQQSILDNTAADYEWWNGFGSEELVKAYGSAEEAYKYYQREDGYRKKYSGQSYEDIYASLMTLGEGEEKNWLRANQADIFGDTLRGNADFQGYVAKGSGLDYTDFGSSKTHRIRHTRATGIDKYRAASIALSEYNGNKLASAEQWRQNTEQIDNYSPTSTALHERNSKELASAEEWVRNDEQINIFRTMEDDEFENLAYCIAYDKEHGTNIAEQYVDSIEETLNARRGHEISGEIADKPIIPYLYGAVAGLDQFATGLENLVYDKDYYIASPTQVASGDIRESLADNGPKLPDWLGGGSVGQGAYDLINTTANMAPSILASTVVGMVNPGAGAVVGNTLMGASAAGNAYQDVINRGYGKNEAKLYAGAIGASEAVLGQLLGGVSKLGGVSPKITKAVAGIDSGLLRFALQYGGKMASEGLEEGLQEILDPILQNAILRADEDINWSEVAYSALLGSLSAGVLELRPTISETRAETALNKEAIKHYGDSTDALIQEGLQSDTKSDSYRLAQKYQQQVQGKDGKAGKAMTGAQIRNLVSANEAQFAVEDYDAAVATASERLTELGETKDVNIIAKLAAKRATGQKLTRTEKSTLVRSQFGAQVAKELSTPTVETQNGTKIYNATYKSLEERVGTEGRFNVSESGQAAIRDGNEAIALDKSEVVTVGDGQVTVKLEDGREVYAGDIDFADESESLLYSGVSDIENITPAAANAIIHDIVDTAKPIGEQLNGIDEAYTYGYNGYSVEDMKAGNFTANLSEQQMMSAYRLGESARKISDVDADAPVIKMRTAAEAKLTAEQKLANQKAMIKSDDVEVYFEDGGKVVKFKDSGKYDAKRMAAVNTARFLSKLGIGGKYYFYESDKNADGVLVYKDADGNEVEAPNGMYKDADGSIHIDLNAGDEGQGTALFTMGHELTHFIKAQSRKQFKVLGDLVTEAFAKTDRSMHERVVAKQDFLSDKRGHHVSYTEAYEEVVADAMSTMLSDGSFYEKIMEIKVKDRGLFNTIKRFFDKMIAKFKQVYAELDPDQQDARDIREMKDMFDRIQTAFAEALVEASDNFHAAMESVVDTKAEPVVADEIITDGAVVTDGEGVRHSIRSMKHDIAEGKMFEDLKNVCGWTDTQVATLRNQLKDLVEYMIPYRNILDMNETYGMEGRRFSPYKPNSDPLYKISMDFSTLCSKRLLTQYVIENLQLRENRPMSDEEQMAIRAMLNEYRKVEKGLQVACAMCYVEAARLKSPQQMQRWLDNPAPLLKDYFSKKNKAFNDSVKKAQADFKESKGYDREAPKKDMKPADVKVLNQIGPKMRTQYQLSAEQQAIVEKAMSLPNSTYLTAGNLANLSETDPVIYDAYTAFVRTATRSKSLETDEPYYYGDSTRDNGNGIVVTDSFIEAVNRENGMRFSSWSDWRIQHLLDYITAVIDNSVRGAAMHGYTKFGDEVRVLGKTGMMFNMSGVAGTQTGLNEDGSLNFSDTESIDVNEAIQLRNEFPETAGLQCIGVGDDHITALLRSDIIDYVIPYHVSGLNAALRRMADIHGWKDYTSTQHAAIDKSIKFDNAVDKEHWHEEPVYSEFFVGYDTGMTGIEAMRASAEKYKQMCKDRGLTPKFNQFANEENYWKLLIDRKMINQQTGKLIRQKAVTPTFDFDAIKGIVDKFVDNYDAGLEKRALNHIVENWDTLPQRIKDLKKQGGAKAKKTKKAAATLANQTVAAQPKDGYMHSDRKTFKNGQNANGVFVANVLIDLADMNSEWWTGRYNHDIFSMSKSDDTSTEFRHFYQEILKRTRDMEDYAEEKQTVYDSFTVTDHRGREFIYRVKLDGYLHGVVLEKIDKAKFAAALKRATKGGQNGKSAANIKGRTRDARSGMGRNSAGSGRTRTSNGNSGHGGLGSGSPHFDGAGNDSRGESADRKVPSVTSSQDFLADGKLKGNYTVSEIGEMFDAWNSDPELADLSKQVFAKLQEITDRQKKAYWDSPYPIRFKSDAYLQKEYYIAPNGIFEPSRSDGNYGITYNLDYFRNVSDQDKARVLLHEAIHACTVGVIKSVERRIPKQADPMLFNSIDGWSDEQKAGLELIQVFSQVRVANERNEYGQKNVYEMVAEMSNPEFRAMLKKQRLWDRIVDAIKRIFGIEQRTAYDAVSDALEKILELDMPKVEAVRYSDRSNAPTFYSQMGKVVEGMKQEKFGASSVISMLRGRGVKAEEIRWSGIHAFLDGKKSVTKAELLDFINGSMLHIEEETGSGGATISLEPAYATWDGESNDLRVMRGGEEFDTLVWDEYSHQFASEETGYVFSDEEEAEEYYKNKYGGGSTRWSDYKLDGGSNYREMVFKMPGSDYSNRAMRVHWGEDAQGVLAHARMQDFEVDGKKMLFIEEIQSDWHNEGQRSGYGDPLPKAEKDHIKETALKEFIASDAGKHIVIKTRRHYELASEADAYQMLKEDPARVGADLIAFYPYWMTEERTEAIINLQQKFDELDRKKAPDAPFKSNYHEYVLKRLLRMAAEEGYDSIGWTTADLQSERWSDDYAEGYRIEYDQDIPKFLKKYGRQWGAEVGKADIQTKQLSQKQEADILFMADILEDGDSYIRDEKGIKEVWSMDITPAMKKSVLEEGQVLYSERGDGTSNRHLLANAFEGITKSSIEYEKIQEYKGHIQELNKLEAKLHQLNAEIRKIRFGTEGARDANRLRQLEEEAKETAKEINRHDRKLLSLEASAPLRKVIDRERKKEAQKTMDHVKQIQESKKIRAEQADLRRKIRKAVRDLDKILTRGNKKRNVKEDVQNVVTKALQAADILFTENYGSYDMLRNGIGTDLSDAEEALVKTCTQMLKDLDKMPTDGYDNWQARQEAEKQLNTKMAKLKDVFIRERKRLNNTTVSSILGELADAYKSLEDSEQSYVKDAYMEPVYSFLKNLQSEVGGAIVQDMTKDQLESVYAAYRMVLTTVGKANNLFNEEIKMSREQMGNAVIQEIMAAGGNHGLWTKGEIARSQASWNNMKPIWVANRIGSESFGKLMQGLFDGQYNFAQDIEEARNFKQEMDKKYHPRNWDAEKQYEFESSTGREFSLNLQQIMSLYAFSKREQAYSHLLNGGFVFEGNSTVIVDKNGRKKTYIYNGATSYKLNEATLNEIINSLTAEQKAYVDEMQNYLSAVMGEKGNEVSMQLYGIKMFKEQFYFPLRSSGAYMEKAKEADLKKEQGQINLVNSGFTHSVKPQAKNPIILSGFLDVWAEHCNEMSMYHSMVLPMEDFRKVYNYSTVHDDKFDSASVYQTIQDAYGNAATSYIDQLYRELNSGATVDPRETSFKARISKFKKAAVMLSASVVVQQFSAIGRAYALIDPKHFIGTKVNSGTQMAAVDEMKKYAPVAIIKEIGGFDTGTKGSAKNYIMAEQYGKGERIKGLMKDEQYRSDIMGFLPAKADEKTWCAIWEAVKRETKVRNPQMDVKSEEFLEMAGARFSEIIEKTQVYDSVLARSANMRSKGALMSMATAFMAEPTTTVNLLEDAFRSGNKKHIARAFGAVAVSIVLNNALASVVYAIRDDDEDETFIEKYFQSLASGMIDDINPMSYYPFLKDVNSLFQGYDVERADMSVIADLRDAVKKAVSVIGKYDPEMDDDELAAYWKDVNGVMMSLLDAGCSAFGVPLKNVRRDVSGLINAYTTVHTDLTKRDTTWMSFWDKVGSAAKDTIPIYAWTKDASKAEILWESIMAEDHKYVARIRSTYKTDDAYHNAVIKQLQENDPRIHEAAQARYDGDDEEYKRIFREVQDDFKKKGSIVGFNAIMSAVNNELSDIKKSESGDSASSNFSATDYVNAIIVEETAHAEAMREDIIASKVANGKTKEEAEEVFTKSVVNAIRTNYESGLLDEGDVEEMLVEYAGMDEWDAGNRTSYWAFCKKYPQYKDLSEERVGKYYDNADPAGIPIDVYFQYYSCTKDMETIYNKWGREVKSRRDQILEFIDSLPLTSRQKDVLYLDAGYKESTLWKAPW